MLFLDKPIVVSELTETIDHLLSIKNSKGKKTRIPQPDRHHLPDGRTKFPTLGRKTTVKSAFTLPTAETTQPICPLLRFAAL